MRHEFRYSMTITNSPLVAYPILIKVRLSLQSIFHVVVNSADAAINFNIGA